MLTISQLILLGMQLTGIKEGNPYLDVVRPRVELAAAAVNEIYNKGFRTKKGELVRIEPLFDVSESEPYEKALEDSEKLTLSIANHESGFQPHLVNKEGDSGIMQVKSHWIWLLAHSTCEEVKKDIKLGMWLGVEVLRMHKKECLDRLPPSERAKGRPASY